MRNHVRTLLAAVAVSAIAGVAYATSPHFVSSSGSVDPANGDLSVSWKEAGLGGFASITYDFADTGASFTYQCFTKSNNKPHGSPQGPFQSSAETSPPVTLPVSSSGNITEKNFDTGIGPVSPPPVSCTGTGLKLCLIAAEYFDVTITDTTNNITESVGDVSGSVTPPSKTNPGVCF